MKNRITNWLYLIVLVFGVSACETKGQSVELKVDFEKFISRHDMVWDRTPDSWTTAPFSGNGNEISSRFPVNESGLYEIDLEAGELVIFTPVALNKTDLTIDAIDIKEEDHHLFGLSKKTERLPGHQNFYEDQKGKKWQSMLSE